MKNWIIVSLGLLIFGGVSMAADAGTNAVAAKLKFYQIRNVKFGDLLRPENANSANGTRIVLYPAQPWKCMTWKFHPAGESGFQLQNLFTSKTFTVKTNGAAGLVQVPFAKDAGKNSTWSFTKLADGLYQITDERAGLALTGATSEEAGEFVVLAPWSEKPEQKWELVETDPSKLTM